MFRAALSLSFLGGLGIVPPCKRSICSLGSVFRAPEAHEEKKHLRAAGSQKKRKMRCGNFCFAACQRMLRKGVIPIHRSISPPRAICHYKDANSRKVPLLAFRYPRIPHEFRMKTCVVELFDIAKEQARQDLRGARRRLTKRTPGLATPFQAAAGWFVCLFQLFNPALNI